MTDPRPSRASPWRERLYAEGLLDPPQAKILRESTDGAQGRRAPAPGGHGLPGPGRGWRMQVARPRVLSGASGGSPAEALRAHEAVVVTVDPVPDPADRVLVVLRARADEEWILESPLGDEAIRASDLERTEDGAYRFELWAGAPGRERVAVGLVPPAALAGLTTAREVRERIAVGFDPVGVVDIDLVE